jgi:mercuric ion binding protein
LRRCFIEGEKAMKRLAKGLAVALVCCGGWAWAATKTVTFSVSNMTCPVCPITLKKALSKVEGVEKVAVSYEKKEAVVTFDDAKANEGKLMAAAKNAGFPAVVKR